MKVKVHYNTLEITGHHPGEEDLKQDSFDLELPDGLEKEEIQEAIEKSMPKGGPRTQHTFERYVILE